MAEKHSPKDFLEWLHIDKAPDWAKAPLLGSVAAALLLVLFLMAVGATFWLLFNIFLAPAATGLGAAGLVVALFGAPLVIWRTFIAQRDLNFKKEGHITDRISKAVEQLGAEKTVKRPERDENGAIILKDGKPVVAEQTVPNIEVRIGGILSLERIAQDSTAYDKGRDHVRCMEILCAYIRENAPASSAKNHPDGDWEPLKDDATEEERQAHQEKCNERFGYPKWIDNLPAPREDIALALKVIGRRTLAQRLIEANWPNPGPATEWVFDQRPHELRASDEPHDSERLKAFLGALAVWKERLSGYHGYRLDLRMTNLQGADLNQYKLEGAEFYKARLEGAVLRHACLQGANFDWAYFERASLSNAHIECASLEQARLTAASLFGARLSGADLFCAQLEWTNFQTARLEGTVLSQAHLYGAALNHARLEGATLVKARLEGASLAEASLEGVDLSRCKGITQAQIDEAFGDERTELPEGLTMPEHWTAKDTYTADEDAEDDDS